MFPALWQIPWGSHSLRITPKSRLTSPGSCFGGAVLALVRPVVPYTLTLSSVPSAGGVSGSSALQQRCPGQEVIPPASYRRVALRPCESSTLLLNLEVIPTPPKLPRRHKTRQSPIDALAGQKPPISLSLA